MRNSRKKTFPLESIRSSGSSKFDVQRPNILPPSLAVTSPEEKPNKTKIRDEIKIKKIFSIKIPEYLF